MKKNCKNLKRLLSMLFVAIFVVSSPLSAFASDNTGYCDVNEVKLENGGYTFEVIDGKLFIISIRQSRMGSGIGKCTVQNKTFSYQITKSGAEESLKAIKQGQTFTNVISLFLGGSAGVVGSIVLGLTTLGLTSPGEYEKLLNTFLNSGNATGHLYFETHCVNRGNMYGEPMYDYVVDRAYVKWEK